MKLDDWLKMSLEDAERRDLPELRPLLEGLVRSTAALRAADWMERVPLDGPAGRADSTREGTRR